MNGEPVFSRRLLIGWSAAAAVVFAISLYFMGGGELGGPDSVGPNTFSRSAIGHAGIAELLQRLGISIVKSQYDSLQKLTPGSVLVLAEPRPTGDQEALRTLLKAKTILLVLPKWTGQASDDNPGWLAEASERAEADAALVLKLVAARASVKRVDKDVTWTTNTLQLSPNIAAPIQLMTGDQLHPLIAGEAGMLLGEIADRDRKVWVLSDPDVISNYGLARDGNAALAVAIVQHLLGKDGSVIFDETQHGFLARPVSPLLLLFRFPFVMATIQAVLAIALLLWATLGRFGAPQAAPPPLSAGRQGLLQNMAKLVEFTGHQDVMIRRYVQETVRDVARQLHAPRELSSLGLITWLQRVSSARGVDIDCGAVVSEVDDLGTRRRRNLAPLIRLAREIHQWKGEIIDGRSRHPRHH